jgi:GT2 family glycosyltransferase
MRPSVVGVDGLASREGWAGNPGLAKRLYVAIATVGRAELLRRTLDSLARCRRPPGYQATVVVENGPKQGAEAVVGAYRTSLATRYLHEPVANKSRALNRALETIGEGLIFFTDDDVRVDETVLCRYAEAASGIEAGQFFGGPIEVDYEEEPPEWLKVFLPDSARGHRWSEPFDPEDPSSFLGFNWAASVRDLRDVGGFDPRLGPGSPSDSTGDETELQSRLRQAGHARAYVPDALVWHWVPRERCSPDWVLERAYRNGVGSGLWQDRAGVKPPSRGHAAPNDERASRFRREYLDRWSAGLAWGSRRRAQLRRDLS